MYLFAQNRVQKYSGAVAARPRAGFARDIMGGGANLALTWVVTAPKRPPRYVIDILLTRAQATSYTTVNGVDEYPHLLRSAASLLKYFRASMHP